MPDETHDSRSLPYFSSEHEILRTQVRRFVETEIKPYAQAWEDTGFVPRQVLRRMGKLGFFGIRYPSQYGGSEMDVLASVVLAEELGRSTFGGVAITVLVHTDMASVHIYNSGTQAIKDRFMPDIISGRRIVAVAVTEPGAGSDVKNIRTTTRRNGNEYVLNGTKMFVTNGVYADLYCVAAKKATFPRSLLGFGCTAPLCRRQRGAGKPKHYFLVIAGLCTARLRLNACARRAAYPSGAAEDGPPMTTTYGFGFDLARPRSRGARIARIDALATLLDTALVIPGTGVRFGLDGLIGLFPVVGDIITTVLSLFIVHEAYQLGAPGHVIARMLRNVALDGVLGAVPLVGDAFDVLWRANRRNVRLLLEWLEHERRR
jgi:hypothetical protein